MKRVSPCGSELLGDAREAAHVGNITVISRISPPSSSSFGLRAIPRPGPTQIEAEAAANLGAVAFGAHECQCRAADEIAASVAGRIDRVDSSRSCANSIHGTTIPMPMKPRPIGGHMRDHGAGKAASVRRAVDTVRAGAAAVRPDLSAPTLAAIFVSGSALVFMRAERDRSQIRGAFSLYLSSDRVEEIARNPKLLELAVDPRDHGDVYRRARLHAHLRAVDPARADALHEPLPDTDDDLIMAKSGTIDKYMGARSWRSGNAPLPVEAMPRARCGLPSDMQAKLVSLNAEWEAEARRRATATFGEHRCRP